MFCWGMNPGGRRWQEYLSELGCAYVEIQAGLARTQLECLPMPPRAEWTWTEAFALMDADAPTVHSEDWGAAWRGVDAALERVLPRARLEGLHEAFAATTSRAPEALLSHGAGWGALERRRLAAHGEVDRLPEELVFPDDSLGPDQAPWLALLEAGSLPQGDPQDAPGHFMAQPEWRAMLEEGIRAGRCDHWLAWLHLGVMRFEALDRQGAQAAWERSLELTRSAWALRNLAVLRQREGDAAGAEQLLRQAWELGTPIAPLALEYAACLKRAGEHEALGRFAAALPDDIRRHERMRILAAWAALEAGRFDEVAPLFDHEFATIQEGEVTLTDLWFAWHAARLADAEGIPNDEALQRRVREECPPPRHIDFRIVGDVG